MDGSKNNDKFLALLHYFLNINFLYKDIILDGLKTDEDKNILLNNLLLKIEEEEINLTRLIDKNTF
jgi:hypothetical protein